MVSTPERRLVLRPRARRQLMAAYDWYEAQRPGLGDALLRAVESVFASIRRGPTLYAMVRGRTRRALVRRYPYGIFFYEREGEGEVVVLAVVHGRRHPRHWPSAPAG